MNPIKKLFIDKNTYSVQRGGNGIDKHSNHNPGNVNDENFENSEVPSLQMRYMIDDYDELFGTSTTKA